MDKIIYLTVLFCFCFVFGQNDSTATIQGKVMIGENGPMGKTIPNTQVTWNFQDGLSLSDTTDINGFYSVNGTITGLEDNPNLLPHIFALMNNYPNPFNPETKINFTVPKSDHIRITVYDNLGKKIKTLTDQNYVTGIHSVEWDGTNQAGQQVASGQYYYSMESNDFHKVKKMSYLKHGNTKKPTNTKTKILHKTTGIDETITGQYNVSETDSTLQKTGTAEITTGQTNEKNIYVKMKDFPPQWIKTIADDTLGINQKKT